VRDRERRGREEEEHTSQRTAPAQKCAIGEGKRERNRKR
jgi:hypothetical protein